ncbi:hypothetical protein GCM10022243_55000 [Saccharothrix violaceirubra]|uniref:Helix-turn-helix protein n=1 Tax=Saccharothrix violaceirubra TaxID=413306 RepID=A0A7W7T5L8_9PSEU|nr:transcriptional regulator [Saccharothrix violaceirubra]MBB4967013.1 hypothetical protein [Saccharothrix violaceirubra]
MRYTVRLRSGDFTKAATLAGLRSDYARSKAMGVHRSTVTRVLAGELRPGAAFIAGALTALHPLDFTDLFEIVEQSPAPKPSVRATVVNLPENSTK